MADKLRDQQNLEALQAKFIGTGSADTTTREWQINVTRDTAVSVLGHPPLMQYCAIGLGESRERTRLALLERVASARVKPKAKEIEDVTKFGLAASVKKAEPFFNWWE